MTRGGTTAVELTGIVSQGAPIAKVIRDRIEVPADKIEAHELLYRVGSPAPTAVGLREGDLLIVERRNGHCATAELVIAALGDLAFIGRWWGKHERRAVMNESLATIVEDARLRVLGVVNVVMRLGPE